MQISIIQNKPVFGKKEQNIENLFNLMNQENNSEIFILPELAYTGYQFTSKKELFELSDTIDSEIIQLFKEKAKEKNSAIIFGFPEKNQNKVYNSSVMIKPNGTLHLYRKTHLFYKENLFFEAGNTGFNVFDFRGLNIGLAICFDWFFPESFRTLALKGADLIAHSSNLVMPFCQKADFTRAIENHIFIATANRIGEENRDKERLKFTGESVCVAPNGEYLISAPKEKEGIFSTKIDKSIARNKKLNKYNTILDRKTEYYFKDKKNI